MISDIMGIVELEPGLGPQCLVEDETFAADATAAAASVVSEDAGIIRVSIDADPMVGATEAPNSYYSALR
ncbi:MAG: hypothetical protein Q8P31_05140 [Bacillota bacterium]|nr:hypothetical protein [Bacillota bacterium]